MSDALIEACEGEGPFVMSCEECGRGYGRTYGAGPITKGHCHTCKEAMLWRGIDRRDADINRERERATEWEGLAASRRAASDEARADLKACRLARSVHRDTDRKMVVMLKAAGFGRHGEPNTVWGMVHVACSEAKALRVKATNRKHRLEVVEPRVDELEAQLSKAHEDAEGYRVNAESDVKNLRDLLRRSFVNGCKMDYLQDDAIDAEVYEALGVADAVLPLATLAGQIEAPDGGKS